ncbi:TPA: hypothetical protein ACW4F9_000354 [Salmonella enterica]
MKLSKWKLMALIIPAAWTSISYAYDWNDDVTQRVQTLIGNAADKYVQGDYDSYNSDTETAINLLLTIEPQPQSPEQIDARKIQAAQLVDETVKKEIISLEQSLEANQAKADAEYQKMQSMSKEEKEQAAAKAAAEKALWLQSSLPDISAHNVYYVKCTRTFKRHVKAAGFVHVKKLLAHKFDPFPAVTLSEFC